LPERLYARDDTTLVEAFANDDVIVYRVRPP
jgi:hypothetical protein